MLFKNSSYVSSAINKPDALNVTILLPSSFRSKKTDQMIAGPYKFVIELPIQQDLGFVIQTVQVTGFVTQTVQVTAELVADVAEGMMIVTIILSIFLTGIMMHMWTMVNSLQIMQSLASINTPMPALVYLV